MILHGCKTRSNVGGIGGIKNSTNNSGWSKKYRNNFIQDCIDKAAETVGASEAYKYCSCMSEKVEAKYPYEADAEGKISSKEIETIKAECMDSKDSNQILQTTREAGWSVYDKKQFINGCTPTVNKNLGTSGAADYCDCLLKRLMQEYPDAKSVDRASKTHLSALASECLGR